MVVGVWRRNSDRGRLGLYTFEYVENGMERLISEN
jgi:hypothetical protein